MRKILMIVSVSILFPACTETPVQSVDKEFDASVKAPTYIDHKPMILFDEGHNNFHTTGGLYKPFADLAKNDGFEINILKSAVTPDQLASRDILVIANAKGEGDLNDTPAFTEPETQLIRSWVYDGGSLLLIADHFPFGSAVENLARNLGFEFQKGMVQDSIYYDRKSNDQSQLEFSKENKLLAEHYITRRVGKVITFTGQSIQCTDSTCFSFLVLSDAAYDMTPVTKVTKDGNDTRVEVTYENPQAAKGRSQGLARELGKGKIVCLGEAAMLTAQKSRDGKKVGMNYNDDNKTLALNILHWLAGKE